MHTEQNISELSNRYLLGVGENQTYTICRLALNSEGQWARVNGKICTTFEQVIEVLVYQELLEEDIRTLEQCKHVLESIYAEIREAICRQQSYA